MSQCHWWMGTFFASELYDAMMFAKQQDDFQKWYDDKLIDYAKWQNEICPETKKLHLQCVFHFTKRMRLTGLKKLHKTAHWDAVKNVEKAIAYCGKEESRVPGSVPIELGKYDIRQGDRSDLLALKDAIQSGKSYDELCDSDGHWKNVAKYNKFVKEQVNRHAAKRVKKTFVVFCYGKPGIGKTLFVHEFARQVLEQELYMLGIYNSGSWMENYDGIAPMLLDDFNGQIQGTQFLRMMDRYACTGDVKGSQVNFAPEYLFITSNFDYWEWYDAKKVNPDAILRRIDLRIDFTKMFEGGDGDVLCAEVAGNTGRHFKKIGTIKANEDLRFDWVDRLVKRVDDVIHSLKESRDEFSRPKSAAAAAAAPAPPGLKRANAMIGQELLDSMIENHDENDEPNWST